ncbi:MAG: gluconolaconase [Bryobacterales bacterium]|nr:gluconolaconase [Bryobacterales bacterium]MBV9399863.1 gluconolaconase [Bryobacterales bacterium]
MAFRKSATPRPEILDVFPPAAIPGGEFQVRGKGLAGAERPEVRFGDTAAPIVIGSDSYVVVRVPEGASDGEMFVGPNGGTSWTCQVGVQIADGVHPVSNPVVDAQANVYTTLSGSAGQKTAVSVYKIDTNLNAKPLVTDIMNATGLALDSEGTLYVSSRNDGVVYQISPTGGRVPYVEGMGVATGIVFDEEDNLYVGDRSGTIFKISRERQIYVFATMEPSLAAYHLAFGPEGYLYVTGPTTSSFDSIARISRDGHVGRFYRGLGRPQGMAFDANGNLYVSASLGGRRGVARITADAQAGLFLSGPSIVGLAFTPSKAMILATSSALYRVNVGIEGRRLP